MAPARARRDMLVVLAGLPGTGKTTVARLLAEELGAVRLTTDELRRRVLRELGYVERKKRKVYDELLRIAADQAGRGRDVVLDGTFFREDLRRAALAVAREAGTRGTVVEVTAPREVAERRLEARLAAGTDDSKAGIAAYRVVRRRFQPVRGRHPVIDTEDEAGLPARVRGLANRLRVEEAEERLVRPLARRAGLRVLRTSISWVLLGGGDAWKVKKPVRLSFLDYSTARKRRRFCRREPCVNRALAGDLYVGVVPVVRTSGGPAFGGEGPVEDYAVRMREMPREARLDVRLRRGRARMPEIEAIGRKLAEFHEAAPRAARRFGSPEGVRSGFAPAFEAAPAVAAIAGDARRLETVRLRVEAFLSARPAAFAARVREGRIRRCHGDVRAANVFVDGDRVLVYDAIEFNDALASCDAAADLAFLAMDLHYFRRPDLASALVQSYLRASGDGGLGAVLEFYMTYRALVRMMTETAVAGDSEATAPRRARARRAVLRYLALAERFSAGLENR